MFSHLKSGVRMILLMLKIHKNLDVCNWLTYLKPLYYFFILILCTVLQKYRWVSDFNLISMFTCDFDYFLDMSIHTPPKWRFGIKKNLMIFYAIWNKSILISKYNDNFVQYYNHSPLKWNEGLISTWILFEIRKLYFKG